MVKSLQTLHITGTAFWSLIIQMMIPQESGFYSYQSIQMISLYSDRHCYICILSKIAWKKKMQCHDNLISDRGPQGWMSCNPAARWGGGAPGTSWQFAGTELETLPGQGNCKLARKCCPPKLYHLMLSHGYLILSNPIMDLKGQLC